MVPPIVRCEAGPFLFSFVIPRRHCLDDAEDVWGLVERLEDGDFADNIGLFSHSRKDIQEKTDHVDRTAHTVGLKSHPAKTKLLKVKSRPRKPVTVRGKELKKVQDFKYLGSFISAERSTIKNWRCSAGVQTAGKNKILQF